VKKIIFSLTIFLFATAFINTAKAQVNVSININSQPDWGPRGYDYVEYYYLPDIGAYYYVPRGKFVYLSGRNWVFSVHLPPAYRHYDLYRGYKVVINEPRAYRYYSTHKVKYAKYKGNHGQPYKSKGGHGKKHRGGH
jgi:hypothetical protein